jgi:hypothetical protein
MSLLDDYVSSKMVQKAKGDVLYYDHSLYIQAKMWHKPFCFVPTELKMLEN